MINKLLLLVLIAVFLEAKLLSNMNNSFEIAMKNDKKLSFVIKNLRNIHDEYNKELKDNYIKKIDYHSKSHVRIKRNKQQKINFTSSLLKYVNVKYNYSRSENDIILDRLMLGVNKCNVSKCFNVMMRCAETCWCDYTQCACCVDCIRCMFPLYEECCECFSLC